MSAKSEKSKVFFLPWERREELPDLIERSEAAKTIARDDLVAVKMHFGERGNDGFIRPELVRPFLKMIGAAKARAFLTDTGTIYNGSRTNAVEHLRVACDHGFTQTRLQTPVIIADGLRGDDFVEVAISEKHFSKVKIATGIRNSDSIIALTHFKGHLLSGFGGTIKNLGMGCGSRLGKFEMHSQVTPTLDARNCTACGACVARCAHGAISIIDNKANINAAICAGCGECIIVCDYGALSITWSQGAAAVQERFAEYALGAVKDRRAFYFNFLNHITPNCDCLSSNETPLVSDIGILASADPVAIDQASLDLVLSQGGDVFKQAHPTVDCEVQLVHAEEIGLGSRDYELVAL